MNANFVDNFQASANPRPNRLLALDAHAKFPESAIPGSSQRRVNGTCAAGSNIRVFNAHGSVVSEAEDGGVAVGWALKGRLAAAETQLAENQALKGQLAKVQARLDALEELIPGGSSLASVNHQVIIHERQARIQVAENRFTWIQRKHQK